MLNTTLGLKNYLIIESRLAENKRTGTYDLKCVMRENLFVNYLYRGGWRREKKVHVVFAAIEMSLSRA